MIFKKQKQKSDKFPLASSRLMIIPHPSSVSRNSAHKLSPILSRIIATSPSSSPLLSSSLILSQIASALLCYIVRNVTS